MALLVVAVYAPKAALPHRGGPGRHPLVHSFAKCGIAGCEELAAVVKCEETFAILLRWVVVRKNIAVIKTPRTSRDAAEQALGAPRSRWAYLAPPGAS